jgi:hypothetical protein
MNMSIFDFTVPIAQAINDHWDPPAILLGKLAVVAVLVGLNGFFVTAEFALVKVRRSRLDTLAA